MEKSSECPLCLEPLEMDDVNFFPCKCGYQVCRFCWHRIRTNENGLCPACRRLYSEDPANFKPLSSEELQELKNQKRLKELQKKQKVTEIKKQLANIRIIQKNLVFVVGLPLRLVNQDPEELLNAVNFKQFGKILKIIINQSTKYAGSQGPSSCAYITYHKSEDALKALKALTNTKVEGRTIKASLGTTKYCSYFLKKLNCPKQECMYVHEVAEEEACFTKEEIKAGKHLEYEQKLYEQIVNNASNASSNQSSSSELEVNESSSQNSNSSSKSVNEEIRSKPESPNFVQSPELIKSSSFFEENNEAKLPFKRKNENESFFNHEVNPTSNNHTATEQNIPKDAKYLNPLQTDVLRLHNYLSGSKQQNMADGLSEEESKSNIQKGNTHKIEPNTNDIAFTNNISPSLQNENPSNKSFQGQNNMDSGWTQEKLGHLPEFYKNGFVQNTPKDYASLATAISSLNWKNFEANNVNNVENSYVLQDDELGFDPMQISLNALQDLMLDEEQKYKTTQNSSTLENFNIGSVLRQQPSRIPLQPKHSPNSSLKNGLNMMCNPPPGFSPNSIQQIHSFPSPTSIGTANSTSSNCSLPLVNRPSHLNIPRLSLLQKLCQQNLLYSTAQRLIPDNSTQSNEWYASSNAMQNQGFHNISQPRYSNIERASSSLWNNIGQQWRPSDSVAHNQSITENRASSPFPLRSQQQLANEFSMRHIPQNNGIKYNFTHFPDFLQDRCSSTSNKDIQQRLDALLSTANERLGNRKMCAQNNPDKSQSLI